MTGAQAQELTKTDSEGSVEKLASEKPTPNLDGNKNEELPNTNATSGPESNKSTNSNSPDTQPFKKDESSQSRDAKTNEKTDSKNVTEISVAIESVLPPPAPGEDAIKVEDQDDYLMYLEVILRQIHLAYYALHDESKGQENYQGTDVKIVIPYVRKKVLKVNELNTWSTLIFYYYLYSRFAMLACFVQGCSMVFSGVVPIDQSIESSRAYSVAVSLGAVVTDKIIPPAKPNLAGSSKEMIPTTHVVAARSGTVKVKDAILHKNIHIVTPDWLWCCAERWEHVDERLFSLINKSSANKSGAAFGSSPDGRKHKRGSKKGEEEDDAIFESSQSTGTFQSIQRSFSKLIMLSLRN